MATILVIDDDVNLLRMLQIMLERGGYATILSSHGEDGIKKATELKPDLVIVDVMMPDVSGHDVCRRLRDDPRTAELPLLVLTARAQPVDRQAALGSGASDYMSKPVSPKVLLDKVRQLLNQPPPSPKEGRLITFLGLRGGSGATSLAVNLAVQLNGAKRGTVCVVDLSPASGHVALQLRMQPRLSWATYRPEPGGVPGEAVKRYTMQHDLGLQVLGSPLIPLQGPGLSSSAASGLMTELRRAFGWVVIDGGPVLDDATVAAIGAADALVLVMSPDVAAVQSTTATLRAIGGLGAAVEHPLIVLNCISPQRGLPQATVEKALSRALAAVIPYDENQLAALAQGVPLSVSQPASPLARGVADLASLLLDLFKTTRAAA